MSLARKVRRPIAAAAVLSAALVALAAMSISASGRTASAKPRFERNFTLLEVSGRSHRTSNGGFITRGKLYIPGNDDIVGHDIVAGRPCSSGRCFKVRALVHINDEGDLKIKGTVRRGAGSHANRRFLIIGGTDDFDGAAGKLIVSSLNTRRTLLHFDFVQ